MCLDNQNTIGLASTQHFADKGTAKVIHSPKPSPPKIKHHGHNATIAVA